MKIVNMGGTISKSEQGASISIEPDSNGPKIKTLRIALSREIGNEVPERAKIIRLKNKKNPDKPGILMMFPEDKKDDRILLIGGFNHTIHRTSVGIDEIATTATILEKSNGYGAWGSGVAFIAVFNPGQRIVSTRHGGTRQIIFENGGEIKSSNMTDEQWAQFNGPTSEMFDLVEI